LIVVLALNLTLIGVALTIEAEARWGAEALAASQLEIYGSIHDAEGLINAFAQRGLSSIGKQSINDKDTTASAP